MSKDIKERHKALIQIFLNTDNTPIPFSEDGDILLYDVTLPCSDHSAEDDQNVSILIALVEKTGLSITEPRDDMSIGRATKAPEKPGEFGYYIAVTRSEVESVLKYYIKENNLPENTTLAECAKHSGNALAMSVQFILFEQDLEQLKKSFESFI